MSRKFKFRAWDKENKKMFIRHSVDISIGGVIAFLDTDGEWKDGKDRIELMQYTGLKDKNDKEIYEGDIVKYTQRHYEDCSREELIDEETQNMIVVFSHQTFGLRKSLNDYALVPFVWVTGCDYEIEVIGNIYESTDMVEEIENGDYGVVECGKCSEKLYRCEALLSNKYLYLCDDCCEEDTQLGKRMIINKYCEQCKSETKHDHEINDSDDVRTTITVCKVCGEVTGDSGPIEIDRIDNSDEEMDCLVCDVGKERACADCCRDWDNEEE